MQNNKNNKSAQKTQKIESAQNPLQADIYTWKELARILGCFVKIPKNTEPKGSSWGFCCSCKEKPKTLKSNIQQQQKQQQQIFQQEELVVFYEEIMKLPEKELELLHDKENNDLENKKI